VSDERRGSGKATKDTGSPRCGGCSADCDVLVLAATGVRTVIWRCPLAVGSDQMDRAVALALIRSSLEGMPCIVVRRRDVEGWN
jgi:hypothetical protein